MNSETRALIERARVVSGALEEYEFEGAAGEGAGLLNALAVALEASAVASPSVDVRALIDEAEVWRNRSTADGSAGLICRLAAALKAAVSSPPTITDDEATVERVALALASFVTRSPVSRLDPGPNRDYFIREARAALAAALHPGGETNG